MMKLPLADLVEFKRLLKLQRENKVDYDMLMKLICFYKEISPYGKYLFNNRKYEPFHLFSINYNINNIEKIVQKIVDHYIIYDDCWTCSGNILPRPKSCYDTKICQMKLRFSAQGRKSPFMELASKGSNSLNIGLARHNFSFIIYHGLEFLFRTTLANNWILHHTRDKFWDEVGSIKVVQTGFHNKLHKEIDLQEKRVYDLEQILQFPIENSKDKNELNIRRLLITKWELEKKLLVDLRSRVDDDPRIMRLIFEINERIKRGL